MLHDEISRKGSFNLIHQGTGIKVDIVLDKETEFYKSEFSRKQKIEISAGLEIYIASPEDVILKKLDFYREGRSEKHLTDIREIIMEMKVDSAYIESWADRLGLREIWEMV